jgi:hypothetical protein
MRSAHVWTNKRYSVSQLRMLHLDVTREAREEQVLRCVCVCGACGSRASESLALSTSFSASCQKGTVLYACGGGEKLFVHRRRPISREKGGVPVDNGLHPFREKGFDFEKRERKNCNPAPRDVPYLCHVTSYIF